MICPHKTLKKQLSGSREWYVCANPECDAPKQNGTSQKFQAVPWDGRVKVLEPESSISFRESYETGFSLQRALSEKYARPRKPKLPKGWRWRGIGEWAKVGDVCCDSRIPPVTIRENGWRLTESHHPVRTLEPKRRTEVRVGETTK